MEYVPIDSLKLHPQNPRQISEKQFTALKRSIKDNPDYFETRPVLYNSAGYIFAGNMRYRAAKELGLKEIPAVLLSITPERERELMILDNHENGEWDYDILANNFTIEELKEWGIDSKELKLDSWQKDIIEDEPPEPRPDPNVKLGDLFQLGNHRLLCGDATKKEEVERLMDGQKADMVFTDPPYGIDYQDVKGSFDKIVNDDGDISSLVWKALAPLEVEVAFVCCNWPSSHDMAMAMDSANLPVKSCIVWDKGSRIQNLDLFAKRHEFILYSGPFGGQPTREDDVWNIPRQTRNDHPTAKPIALCAKAIGLTDGQTVADPFGGSGSTLIAREQLNRKCYMMEIDPRYVRVIIDRWEKLTGQKAQLIGGDIQ